MATEVLVGVLGQSWRSREREIEEETGTRESERGVGEAAWRLQGRPEGGGKQEVAGRAPACVGHALGVLLVRWRRRLALGQWAAGLHRARPQVSSLFCFLFYF